MGGAFGSDELGDGDGAAGGVEGGEEEEEEEVNVHSAASTGRCPLQ